MIEANSKVLLRRCPRITVLAFVGEQNVAVREHVVGEGEQLLPPVVVVTASLVEPASLHPADQGERQREQAAGGGETEADLGQNHDDCDQADEVLNGLDQECVSAGDRVRPLLGSPRPDRRVPPPAGRTEQLGRTPSRPPCSYSPVNIFSRQGLSRTRGHDRYQRRTDRDHRVDGNPATETQTWQRQAHEAADQVVAAADRPQRFGPDVVRPVGHRVRHQLDDAGFDQ